MARTPKRGRSPVSPDQASKRQTPNPSPARAIISRNPKHEEFERKYPYLQIRSQKDHVYLKAGQSRKIAESIHAFEAGHILPKYKHDFERTKTAYETGKPLAPSSQRSLKEIPANQDTQYPHSSDSAPPPSVSNLPPEKLPSATEESEEDKVMKEQVTQVEQELKRQADIPKYDGTEATGGKLPEKTVAGLPLGNVGEFADRIPTQYKTDDDGKILLDTEAMEQRKAYEKAMKPVVPEPTGEILKLLKEMNTRELLKASEREKRDALKAKMRKRFTVLDKSYFLKY